MIQGVEERLTNHERFGESRK